jgi:outer membrane protein assembly factor BamB
MPAEGRGGAVRVARGVAAGVAIAWLLGAAHDVAAGRAGIAGIGAGEPGGVWGQAVEVRDLDIDPEVLQAARAAVAAEPELMAGFVPQLADEATVAQVNQLLAAIQGQRWDEAFGLHERLLAGSASLLTAGPDGMFIPVRQTLRQQVLDLPPAGRRAFEAYFDGQARDALARADALPAGSRQQIEAFARAVDRYLLSSHGDVLADRLAELYLERGRYAQARRLWSAILQHHPGTQLDTVALRLKAASADARTPPAPAPAAAADRDALAQRYGDRPVTAAGTTEPLAHWLSTLDRLAAAHADLAHASAAPQAGRVDVAGAAALVPLWTHRFNLQPATGNALARTGPPTIAAVADVVAVNLLGTLVAVDAATGNRRWATGDPASLQTAQQNVPRHMHHRAGQQFGVQNLYGTTPAGNLVAATLKPAESLLDSATPSRLTVLTAHDGRTVWSSAAFEDTAGLSFIGDPLVRADELLCLAYPTGEDRLHLAGFALRDGSARWSLPLGRAQLQADHAGNTRTPRPRMATAGRRLIIHTDNGAVLAVDPVLRQIAWAYSYAPQAQDPQARRIHHLQLVNAAPGAAGLATDARVAVFRDSDQPQVHAVDVHDARVLWSADATHRQAPRWISGGLVYLAGSGVSALQLTDGRQAFTTPSSGRGIGEALVAHDRLSLLAAGRLLEIARQPQGRPALGRSFDIPDLDTGGSLIRHADRIYAVTLRGIVALPAAPDAPHAAATATPSPPHAADEAQPNPRITPAPRIPLAQGPSQ